MSKRQRSKTNKHSTTIINSSAKRLPHNFAEELLNLELDIEQQDPLELLTITQLIQTAIEYYESQKNDRYLVFQTKIQNLMQNSRVIASMSQGQSPSKKQNFANTLQEQKKASTLKVQDLLYNAQQRTELIQADMKTQETGLLERVKLRRQKIKKQEKDLEKIEINSDKQETEEEEKCKNINPKNFNIWKQHIIGAMNIIKEQSDSEEEEENQEKKAELRQKSIQMLKHASIELDAMVKNFQEKGGENGKKEVERVRAKSIRNSQGLYEFKKKYSICINNNLEKLKIQSESKFADLFAGKFQAQEEEQKINQITNGDKQSHQEEQQIQLNDGNQNIKLEQFQKEKQEVINKYAAQLKTLESQIANILVCLGFIRVPIIIKKKL